MIPDFSRIRGPLLRIGFALTLALSPAGSAPAAERPNVLLIIADDWSYPHAGAYGDRTVRTPRFDRLAAEGALFSSSFCASPSCTPSRGALLTGRPVHQLENGANLWSVLPSKFATYPDRLAKVGYKIGQSGKGWGPGTIAGTGRPHNPAGPPFASFDAFLKTVPDGTPFCFWHGSQDPHRPYDPGSGRKAGLRAETVGVPPFLPDNAAVRDDLLDYYAEVERFDRTVGELLDRLEKSGRSKNTLVIITSDNGLPFPRSKANLYDSGTHMPLAIRWPAKIKPGRKVDAFVGHADLAPTILEAAGLGRAPEMTGRSLYNLLTVGDDPGPPRDAAFVERERHANVRKGDLSYPSRAVRTREFLYIKNLRPERWPAGDPEKHVAVGPFGDIDGGPSKDWVLDRRRSHPDDPFVRASLERRPAEELYDLARDPHQLANLAGRPEYARAQADLRARLETWMRETDDPADDRFDKYPYVSATNGRRIEPQRRREHGEIQKAK